MNEMLMERMQNVEGFKELFETVDFFKGPIKVSDEFIEKVFCVGFNSEQLCELFRGVWIGRTEEQLTFCLRTDLHAEQIKAIIIEWYRSEVSISELEPYARTDVYYKSMYDIPYFIKWGLTKEQIELCILEKHADKRRLLAECFSEGLNMEQVSLLAKSYLSWEQAGYLAELFDLGLSMDEVLVYATSGYTWAKLSVIVCGYENGLTKEDIAKFANPKLKMSQMQKICDRLIAQKKI